jgi:hypothetical protein
LTGRKEYAKGRQGQLSNDDPTGQMIAVTSPEDSELRVRPCCFRTIKRPERYLFCIASGHWTIAGGIAKYVPAYVRNDKLLALRDCESARAECAIRENLRILTADAIDTANEYEHLKIGRPPNLTGTSVPVSAAGKATLAFTVGVFVIPTFQLPLCCAARSRSLL